MLFYRVLKSYKVLKLVVSKEWILRAVIIDTQKR
jgi:hypothetical protein